MILKGINEKIIKSSEFKELDIDSTGAKSVEGISPAAFPVIISSIFNKKKRPTLLVVENYQKLNEMYTDLSCFMESSELCRFPSWEILPYEFMSPPESIERDRITSIYRVISEEPALVIATAESLMRKIPAKEFFIKKGLTLECGEEYPFDDIVETLVQYGYTRESRVESFGHFSVKGGIIDVFLPTQEDPLRMDFFGDTLESVREFDADSQTSTGRETFEQVTIYPRKELVLFKGERDKLRQILRKNIDKKMDVPDEIREWLDDEDSDIDSIPGLTDLFQEIIPAVSFLDYFDESSTFILSETPGLIAASKKTEKIIDDLYAKRKKETWCAEPGSILSHDIIERLMEHALSLQTFTTSSGANNWSIKSVLNFQGKIKMVREEISRRLEEGWEVIVTTSFEGQARRLSDLFSSLNPDNNYDVLNSSSPLNIVMCPLNTGAEFTDIKTIILTDNEIFGKSYRKRKHFKSKKSRPIESFLDLKPGDYVVHINHGIGTFEKIERMTAGGVERDFLLIEYADSDKLYVALDQINLVQKYVGIEGRKPRIDCLGKKSAWNKIRDKVKESVEETAKELIKIYAKRNALKGFRYPPDTQWQEEFEALFEFEETPDQMSAIEDVKDDMEADKPMDRLICGDVGFGKTEVAIRSAFKAVMAGKQVAILVPTTVLAMQHYSTFRKRFKRFPINIEMMSRFRTKSELAKTKHRLAEAEVDIVIGTHALVANDVKIKNLGLLIIDEEQRFGVKHKEQLKKFRTMVDVLTLSATPIPRTLHMSMAGIRDLSVITTPPENRQSIETYVIEENPDILRQAILDEINREGQVFYVYNRVQTIEVQMIMLQKLVPEASFCIAHGQMHEHELEEIMIDFMDKKYDVLISTTIIESGIDMPNVNTIIIDRADTFGLSQLYQLKGRVGRSVRKAYAYLFYPRHASMTEEAQKRLKVISENSELGSGFKIAMKDLEIRGSGNILGREQSGSIMEVGFDLYCQMLEDAVARMKGEEVKDYFRTPVFIKSDFFIPDTYISDARQKIEFYKRFESCETVEEVDSLEAEMIDRFGMPAEEVVMLIDIERVRALASVLRIAEILEDPRRINIKINSDCTIPRDKLIAVMAKDKRISMDTSDPENLIFKAESKSVEKKITELKKWLQQFI